MRVAKALETIIPSECEARHGTWLDHAIKKNRMGRHPGCDAARSDASRLRDFLFLLKISVSARQRFTLQRARDDEPSGSI
jgi:hypothetical protein